MGRLAGPLLASDPLPAGAREKEHYRTRIFQLSGAGAHQDVELSRLHHPVHVGVFNGAIWRHTDYTGWVLEWNRFLPPHHGRSHSDFN